MSDYEVGRGRPPRKNRFQKGQSGNRRGRPKKPKGPIKPLGVLDEPVVATVNGSARKLCAQEARLRKQIQKALKQDDLGAILYLIRKFEKFGLLEPETSAPVSSVITVPGTMPWDMTMDLHCNIGPPPWSEDEIAWVRQRYLAKRTEEDRLFDEAMAWTEL